MLASMKTERMVERTTQFAPSFWSVRARSRSRGCRHDRKVRFGLDDRRSLQIGDQLTIGDRGCG